MEKNMRLQLLLVFLCMMMFEGFLSVATAQEQSQNGSLLQGTWHVVQVEGGGNVVPQTLLPEIVYVFDANKLQVTINREKVTYKLGYSNGQNTLDTIGKDGMSLGIYKVVKERLVICFNDQSRPTEFATKPESQSTLVILEKSPASLSSEVITGIPEVVVERFTGTTLKNKAIFTFLPGEQVMVLKSSPTSFLVDSISRDGDTIGGVWVPRKILISQDSFKLVEKWAGEKHVELVEGDYEADYSFDSAGGFKRRSFDQNGRPFVVRGHLYIYKNILWAKANNESFMQVTSLFIVKPGGKLCWLTPGEECSPP
jgi:uncharacterized protein (TIGR03067 family)